MNYIVCKKQKICSISSSSFFFLNVFMSILIGWNNQIISSEPEVKTNVKLALQWEHQAQFAGYYMAKAKGFYEDENLDVDIIHGGADVDHIQLLKSGQVDFCIAMLLGALETNKLRNVKMHLVSQIVNRSNFVIVAWNSGKDDTSEIFEPLDLQNKTISIWESFRPPYQVFFDKYKIKPNILPQYYTFSLFLNKGVDACSAMLYNEFHGIRQSDVFLQDLTVFKFHELGVNFPEDGIYCLKEKAEKQPEVCDAFARASLKGWEYAKNHQEETLDVIMKYIEEFHLPTNRSHMNWMLKIILGSIFPSAKDAWIPGILSKQDFQKSISILGLNADELQYKDFVIEGARDGLD